MSTNPNEMQEIQDIEFIKIHVFPISHDQLRKKNWVIQRKYYPLSPTNQHKQTPTNYILQPKPTTSTKTTTHPDTAHRRIVVHLLHSNPYLPRTAPRAPSQTILAADPTPSPIPRRPSYQPSTCPLSRKSRALPTRNTQHRYPRDLPVPGASP